MLKKKNKSALFGIFKITQFRCYSLFLFFSFLKNLFQNIVNVQKVIKWRSVPVPVYPPRTHTHSGWQNVPPSIKSCALAHTKTGVYKYPPLVLYIRYRYLSTPSKYRRLGIPVQTKKRALRDHMMLHLH